MHDDKLNRRDWLQKAAMMSFGAVAAACAGKRITSTSAPTRPGGLRDSDLVLSSRLPVNMKDSYIDLPNVPGKYIALTYDDGPHASLTPRLLDILRDHNVKSTFFLIGQNVNEYPKIVRRELEEGHQIANHSYSHPSLTTLSNEGVVSQISRTDDAIMKATGTKPNVMRPPYGAVNARVKQVLMSQFNYPSILWSCDPLDWKRPGSSVVAQRLISGASKGGILLAHDIHSGTVDATPRVLQSLLGQGYQFVTVDQLIALGSTPSLGRAPIYSPAVL